MALDAQSQSLITAAQVKLGLRHSVVAAVRDLLYKANVPAIYSPADPFLFDAGLRDQVLAFQKKVGLGQDGIVGPKTWNALTGMAPDVSVVQVAPGGATPGAPASGGLGAFSILLMAAGGWLIYRWFAERKGFGDYSGAPEVGAIVKAESDARIGNCHRARRRLRLIQPNVISPTEQEMFRKAVQTYRKRCEGGVEPERGPRARQFIEAEEREALVEQMTTRQQLKQGRPVRLEEDALRREYLDLRQQIADTAEHIEMLKEKGSLKPAEEKELVRLETDRAALQLLTKDKRDQLRAMRKRIDQESGLVKVPGGGRSRSRTIAKIYKTGPKHKRDRPTVVDVVATPTYVERETAEDRAHLYPLERPKTPAQWRARRWIEERLNRQPTRVTHDAGSRRVATLQVRRPTTPTEAEYERRYKSKGFKMPKPRGPYKKKPKE